MARTIINLPLRNSVDESYNTAVNILQANGFKEVSYNGETVWKKGTGLLTAMQYIGRLFTTSICCFNSATSFVATVCQVDAIVVTLYSIWHSGFSSVPK